MLKNYYCIKQHDITDCGAACLATIAKQYGLKKPISQIRLIAGTDTKGTSAFGLVKAAEKLGFVAKGVKAEQKNFTDKLPLPAVAHVIKENLLHYVVVHEIKNDSVIIADPEEGLVTYQKDDFFKIWSGVLILMIPDNSFQKGDETTGLFNRFLSLIFPHKKLIGEIFLSSLLFALLGILGAFYFKYLIDEILINGLQKTLHIISVGVVLLTLFKVLMDGFRKHLLLHLSQKIDIALIFSYYKHVLKLPMSFFDSRKVGEILSRLNDAYKIRTAISGATLSVLIDTLMIIGGGVVLYIQCWQLFLVALFFIPFSIAVVWLFTKPFQKNYRNLMGETADTEAYLVESLNGIGTIKAMNAQNSAVFDTEKKFVKVLKSIFKVGWMQNLQASLQTFLTLLGGVIVLWIGSVYVIKGTLSVGQLITFNALLAYFFEPIKNLIGLQPTLQEAIVAADRLGEILDLEIEAKDDDQLLSPDFFYGDIQLKNVTFGYGTRQNVLEDINLTIKAGDKVAIVGESGSGKTTLAKLLLKYYLPKEGEILIDNNNIKDLQTENLRNKTGYVPQDIFLFSGSIRENIAFGQRDANFENIVDAAQSAMAHSFINDMPLRYDTMVGERGATLSGGQKQRLALARIILKKPNMIILDEATSNLDSIAEKAIHETIDKISNGVTTIIIAHRLSTIMRCNKIVVLEKGRICEFGSHSQLLNNNGKYSELWNVQLNPVDYPVGEVL
ncbi:MAG: peptidase domain-containing ABC transporter [Spirochaetes bacterium]|nr:peptidase domain-containing ABC transporter [Spirochaetota bacterium]